MAIFNNTNAILLALKGEDGGGGNKIRYGSANPSSFDGWAENDVFINTTTKVFYSYNGSILVEVTSFGSDDTQVYQMSGSIQDDSYITLTQEDLNKINNANRSKPIMIYFSSVHMFAYCLYLQNAVGDNAFIAFKTGENSLISKGIIERGDSNNYKFTFYPLEVSVLSSSDLESILI